jgi:hypothetical protein
MKRAILALTLIAASPLLAFDAEPVKPSIGIVQAAGIHPLDRSSYIQKSVSEALRNELRRRGFEAFTQDATIDDIRDTEDRRADYYVEIISGAELADYGGVGVGGRHGDVSLGVLASRVAADVRIFDGKTMSVLSTETLSKKNTAVVPTSIGLGDRGLFAFIALPFIERAQVRSVTRAVAKEMAVRVLDVVQAE